MSICCCSLAGTAACQYCSNNPAAIRPPVIRSSSVTATDKVLIGNNLIQGVYVREEKDDRNEQTNPSD